MSLILDLIYPKVCVGCNHTGYYLCPTCRSKLIFKSIAPDDRLSLFRYHGTIKKLITDLKFGFVSDSVSEISELICWALVNRYPHLLHYWQENNYIFVPIPLHENRQNWRGFNQSELICQKLSSELNLGYNSDLLLRTKSTPPQTTIHDRRLRRLNTQSSFTLNNGQFPPGQRGIKGDWNFILFDDVFTTGSTINSAKSVFPSGSNIWTLTIAG